MQGRDIILVGGGNSAGQAAVFFADYARSVTILIRGESLAASMSRYLIDELARKPNVHVRTGGEIARCTGDDAPRVRRRPQSRGRLARRGRRARGCSSSSAPTPNTGWLPKEIICDERGYVCTGRDVTDLMPEAWPLERDPYLLETSVPGIFSAGDVRHGSIKRVASGVGEGSIAIAFVHEHLADLAAPPRRRARDLEVVVDEAARALADVGRDRSEDRARGRRAFALL